MFNFLSQRVISTTSEVVNSISIVIVCNEKELIIIVYKLKNLCNNNKIMYNTNITLKFLVLLLIMLIKDFQEFLRDKMLLNRTIQKYVHLTYF